MHNESQDEAYVQAELEREMGEEFERIKLAANLCLGQMIADANENESLALEYPEWDVAEAVLAERWINDRMETGWRVYVRGFQLAPRHAAHLQGMLRNVGWGNAEVAPV